MEFETLNVTNLDFCVHLVQELWIDSDFEEEKEELNEILLNPNQVCYLAKEDEEYIGFVHSAIRNDYVEGAESLPIAYIEALFVKKEYQNKGIARKLISLVEEWAKLKKLNQIASDTPVTNVSSIDFHKKIGFTEVERIVCFVKNLE